MKKQTLKTKHHRILLGLLFAGGVLIVIALMLSHLFGRARAAGEGASYSGTKLVATTPIENQATYLYDSGVKIDSQGNTYVAGSFSGSVNFNPSGSDVHTSTAFDDVYLTKYNADGSYGWTKTFGGDYIDESYHLTIDSNDNVYITGLFSHTVDFNPDGGGNVKTAGNDWDMFVTKYNADGSYGWTKTTNGSSYTWGFNVQTDGAGNVYVMGETGPSTVNFNPDGPSDNITPNTQIGFLTKYNADGTYQWTKTNTAFQYFNQMQVDSDGSINVAGWFNTDFDFSSDNSDPHTYSGSGIHVFVAKFDTNGQYQSVHTFTTNNPMYLYLHGNFIYIIDESRLHKINYSTDQEMWAIDSGDCFKSYDSGSPSACLTADDNENIYMVGRAPALTKYDSSGNVVWTKNTQLGYDFINVNGAGDTYYGLGRLTTYDQTLAQTGDFNPDGAADVRTFEPKEAYSFLTKWDQVLSDLQITTSSLATGGVGTAYSDTIATSGATGNVTYSISVGNLPAGLSLNASTGEISGTPTDVGTSQFTISAQDDVGTVTKQLGITINSAATPISITTTSLPSGTKDHSYSTTIEVANALGSVTYSVSSGSLPPGISLNTSSGAISGTPTLAGTFNFQITANDGTNSASHNFSIVIAAPSSSGGGDGGGGGGSSGSGSGSHSNSHHGSSHSNSSSGSKTSGNLQSDGSGGTHTLLPVITSKPTKNHSSTKSSKTVEENPQTNTFSTPKVQGTIKPEGGFKKFLTYISARTHLTPAQISSLIFWLPILVVAASSAVAAGLMTKELRKYHLAQGLTAKLVGLAKEKKNFLQILTHSSRTSIDLLVSSLLLISTEHRSSPDLVSASNSFSQKILAGYEHLKQVSGLQAPVLLTKPSKSWLSPKKIIFVLTIAAGILIYALLMLASSFTHHLTRPDQYTFLLQLGVFIVAATLLYILLDARHNYQIQTKYQKDLQAQTQTFEEQLNLSIRTVNEELKPLLAGVKKISPADISEDVFNQLVKCQSELERLGMMLTVLATLNYKALKNSRQKVELFNVVDEAAQNAEISPNQIINSLNAGSLTNSSPTHVNRILTEVLKGVEEQSNQLQKIGVSSESGRPNNQIKLHIGSQDEGDNQSFVKTIEGLDEDVSDERASVPIDLNWAFSVLITHYLGGEISKKSNGGQIDLSLPSAPKTLTQAQ